MTMIMTMIQSIEIKKKQKKFDFKKKAYERRKRYYFSGEQ